MYTMTLTDAVSRMPTNGRGGSAIARVITTATITAATATTVTVTALGPNVAVGDILIAGQGNWGVATAVDAGTNTVTVKRWYRVGGGVGTLPPASGSLIAHPGGVLRTAVASIIRGAVGSAAANTATLTDVLGTNIAVAVPFDGTPIKMWGPWRATGTAAQTTTLSFETVGDLDT